MSLTFPRALVLTTIVVAGCYSSNEIGAPPSAEPTNGPPSDVGETPPSVPVPNGSIGQATDAGADAGTSDSPLTDVVAIAASRTASFAARADGTVFAWGYDGTTTSTRAHVVQEITGATAVAAGDSFACAIVAGGGVTCWGAGGAEIGVSANGGPTAIKKADGTPLIAKAIAAREKKICAVETTGSVVCWGQSRCGELGVEPPPNQPNTSYPPTAIVPPTTVAGLEGAVGVTLGRDHTCALVQESSGRAVFCWGNSSGAQLGEQLYGESTVSVDGGKPLKIVGGCYPSTRTITPKRMPVDAASGSSVAAGDFFTCVDRHPTSPTYGTGGLFCWGSNKLGLGLPCAPDPEKPYAGEVVDRQVCEAPYFPSTGWAKPPPTLSLTVHSVSAGSNFICMAHGTAGKVTCATDAHDTVLPELGLGMSTAKAVSFDGTPSVPGLERVQRLVSGERHTCALAAPSGNVGGGSVVPGTVWCWGYNQYGQLGRGWRGDLAKLGTPDFETAPAKVLAPPPAGTLP